MRSLKEMITNGQQVFFVCYQDSNLWYQTECGFEFSVPLDDTGDGSFIMQDKASLFMRWINKQIKSNEVVHHDMPDLSSDVQFVRYQKKELWYQTQNLDFSIPLSDTEHTIFWKQNSIDFFQSWIEKAKKEYAHAQSLMS